MDIINANYNLQFKIYKELTCPTWSLLFDLYFLNLALGSYRLLTFKN